MRYSDRITFITETDGGYNPNTGNHDEATKTLDIKACHISTLGTDRTAKLFGEIDVSIIVARLQRPYRHHFDYVEIDGVKYNVKRQVHHRTQSVFYLEGAP